MKRILMGGVAFGLLSMAAGAATAQDHLTATGQVPHSCGVGGWSVVASNRGSFNATPGSIGTLSYSNSDLVDAASAKSQVLSNTYAVTTLAAPMYCNITFDYLMSASTGALKRNGSVSNLPSGFATQWLYKAGAKVGTSAANAVSGISTPSSNGSPANFADVTDNSDIGNSNYIGIKFVLLPIIPGQPLANQPRMVAGTYNETFTLTLTPQ